MKMLKEIFQSFKAGYFISSLSTVIILFFLFCNELFGKDRDSIFHIKLKRIAFLQIFQALEKGEKGVKHFNLCTICH